MAQCDMGEGVKKCLFMSEVLFELALWVIAHGKMFKKCGSLSKIYRQSFDHNFVFNNLCQNIFLSDIDIQRRIRGHCEHLRWRVLL